MRGSPRFQLCVSPFGIGYTANVAEDAAAMVSDHLICATCGLADSSNRTLGFLSLVFDPLHSCDGVDIFSFDGLGLRHDIVRVLRIPVRQIGQENVRYGRLFV